MRALFLATHTPDCEKFWLSWAALHHAYAVARYDDRPHDRHHELVREATEARPDVIVFIGAIEEYHGKPVPTPEVLRRLRDVAPTVHICGDASDEPWWPWLETYDREGCFAAQVSVDGNRDTPIAGFANGLVRLTPTCPDFFDPIAWSDRKVPAGMAGALGHGERLKLVSRLSAGPLTWLNPDRGASYADMCRFLSGCKVVVNHPMNGSGNGEHVKGRVIETGWAGACLLERVGSPTAEWFTPGEDYLEYADVDDARERLRWAVANDVAVEGMAARFHRRVADEHGPAAFWEAVLDRAGVTCT